MEKFITELIKNAQASKESLHSLKQTALRCQMFEFAAELRDLETKLFPETEEVKEIKETANKAHMAFQMVGLGTEKNVAWLLYETSLAVKKLKGKFSLKDAAILQAKKNEVFGEGK